MPPNPGWNVDRLVKANKLAWLDLIMLVDDDLGNHWRVRFGLAQCPFTLQNWLQT